jgi:hypothetical protein
VPPTVDLVRLRSALAVIAATHAVDVHMQQEAVSRRGKRLVVFDMDSTLIRQECIDELARLAGQYDQVQACTHTQPPTECVHRRRCCVAHPAWAFVCVYCLPACLSLPSFWRRAGGDAAGDGGPS